MPLGDYLTGLAFFAVTTGSSLAAAAFLARRRLPHLRGAALAVAFALLATAALIAAHLLPGLVGALSRWSAAGCALVLALAAWRVPAVAAAAPGGERHAPPASGGASTLLAGLAVGGLSAFVAAELWKALATPSTGIDTLTFHLPNVVRWMQTESFWRVDQFTPLLANGNYPHNGDVVFLAALLPWENDAFARLVNAPFVAISGLAAYATALEAGSSRATAALAAAAFASMPVVSLAAYGGAQTDPIFTAAFAGGVLFLVRHFRHRRRSDLVLAGLGLGLAFGTKWYGVSSVAVVLALWAALSVWAGRPVRRVAAQGGMLACLVLAAGGFWLLRNLVISGNPLHPVELGALGVTVFDAPRDFIRECAGFTLARYLGDPGVLREFVYPAFEENYGLPGLLLGLGLLGTGALAPIRRRRRVRGSGERYRVALALSGCAVLLAAAYTVTPYSGFGPEGEPILVGANARYLLPALVAAVGPAAWAVSRAGRLRLPLELLLLLAVADGIRRGLDATVGEALLALVGLALLGGGAFALLRLGRTLPGRAAPVFYACALLLVGASAVAAGHERQQAFNDGRYLGPEPAIDWILTRAPEDRRVGLAGTWNVQGLAPVLPAFGPRFGNVVSYLGPTVDGQLREFDSQQGWERAARRRGYDLLIVGRDREQGADCPIPGKSSDDQEFARSAGFEKLAESERLALYRVR